MSSSHAAPARRRRRAAFTIPEVAFAVLVMALAITTALAAMQRAFLELDTARNLQIAGQLMQSQIEKERLMSWGQVSDPAYRPAMDAAFMREPAVASRFTLARAVAALPERSGQMVQVTLTVTWRTYDGRSVSRSYVTYFCQGGLNQHIYDKA